MIYAYCRIRRSWWDWVGIMLGFKDDCDCTAGCAFPLLKDLAPPTGDTK